MFRARSFPIDAPLIGVTANSGNGCCSKKLPVPSAEDGVNAGVATGKGEACEASRLAEGRYSQGVPCFTQFAQSGFCSSHLEVVSLT